MVNEPMPSFFIDYPTEVRDIAIGDLVCWQGSWHPVKKIAFDDDEYPYLLEIHGAMGWITLEQLPIPRIAKPLLDALKDQRDPYRD